MGQVIITRGAQSSVDQATAITALNVLIAAEIVIAHTPTGTAGSLPDFTSVQSFGYAATGAIAVGPLERYCCSIVMTYTRP